MTDDGHPPQNEPVPRAEPAGPAADAPQAATPDGAAPGFRLSIPAILEAARAAEREEVMAEIRAMRNEKSGWGSKLLILVGSFAVFFALGLARKNPLEWLLVIVAAIAIHEAGHYLGMRIFGYRDVRMFFIPLFGAAVSGRSGGAAGWKRAVVALLGPLPGIAAGMACAVLWRLHPDQAWLHRLAWAFLLINVLNLLPFYPLDGGRLVQDVLLARNRFVDAAFRTSSGLLFAGLGLFLVRVSGPNGWVLVVFGLVSLAGVPGALTFGRMTARLRPELGAAAAAGADSGDIPPEALDRLIAEVRRENPRLPDARAVAWRAETLWERLQVRLPSLQLALAFLAVQGLALAAGLAAALELWHTAQAPQ